MKPFDIKQLKKEFSLYCKEVKKYPMLKDPVQGEWGEISLDDYVRMGMMSEYGEFLGAVRATYEPWSTKSRDALDEIGDVMFYAAWGLGFKAYGCGGLDSWEAKALTETLGKPLDVHDIVRLPTREPFEFIAILAGICENIEPGGFAKALDKNMKKLSARSAKRNKDKTPSLAADVQAIRPRPSARAKRLESLGFEEATAEQKWVNQMEFERSITKTK